VMATPDDKDGAYVSSGGEYEDDDIEDIEEDERARQFDIFFRFGLHSPLRMLASRERGNSRPEPLVQSDSDYSRLMYWTCIQDSGFPNRVNHAVATHR